MTGEQRGLLESDIRRLTEQRDAALHRHAEAMQARSRAKEMVYQAQAAADHAAMDVELLGMEIDRQLDALNETS